MSHVRIIILISLLWLAGLGAAAQFAKIAVPFELFAQIYPDAGASLGWLLSVISVLGVVFGMTASLFIARWGFVMPLLVALVLGAILSLAQAGLPDLPQMLALRAIEGVSHLVIVVAAPTLIGYIAPQTYRGVAMTIWSTFFGVAFAVVAWGLLPQVEIRGVGWLMTVHGVYMGGVALCLMLAFRSVQIDLSADISPIRASEVLRRHIDAYRSPSISAPAIGWLFYTLTYVSLLAVMPGLLPDATRATVSGWMPLMGIAGSMLFVPPLLRRLKPVQIVMLGFSLGFVMLAFGLMGATAALIALLLFLVLGLVQGGSFAAIPQLNESATDQAMANGALAQMGNLGNSIGTPILLYVLQVGGQSGMFLTVMAIYLAAIVAHVWLSRRRAV